jgi:(E)-4-hydroxy-3-methylbut-2-enyl-diphosphate synthase
VAFGILLNQGIGDTIRVSLTADSIEEVFAGHQILQSLNLRRAGSNLVSCPSCGRCEVNLHELANNVEGLIQEFDKKYPDRHLDVAVMGCFVNGPGEAGHADIGIAGGKDGEYYIFKGEERVMKVRQEEALEIFKAELEHAYDTFDPNTQAHKKAESLGPNWQTATKDAEVLALEEHMASAPVEEQSKEPISVV